MRGTNRYNIDQTRDHATILKRAKGWRSLLLATEVYLAGPPSVEPDWQGILLSAPPTGKAYP